MRIKGKKLKMSQIYKESRALGVTPVKAEGADFGALKAGDLVNVSAISRGKGFQGVVKRHGFSGGPKTHGQKNRHRAPGSIGNTTPQRTLPGRRMAGRMGGERVTVKNIEIVEINSEQKIIFLKGATAGGVNAEVEIYK